MTLDRDAFIKHIEQFFENGVEIIRRKNADYAGNGDPFRNFYAAQAIGVTDAKTALMVRMSDKMTRIANLLKQEAQVKDESVLDTLQDLANYAAILSAMFEHEKTAEDR